MRRSGKNGSAGVITLLMLLAVGPLLSAMHELVAEHRYCAEHQTIEEMSDEMSLDGASVELVTSVEPAQRSRVLAARDADDHDECPLAQALASRVRVPRPTATFVAPVAPAAFTTSEATASPRAPTCTLSVAPKTSPPSSVV
jgi:hypothetical protein